MSSPRNPPPDLLSLPNEILAQICVYVDDDLFSLHFDGLKWLKAVRLTCKQLYVPSTTEFVKRYLKRPKVVLSRHGLQEFVELCKHPLFGPHVQDIGFDSCRLDSKFVQELGAQMDSLITNNKLNAVKHAKEYLNWYLLKLEEELQFEGSGDMSVLLKKAFATLQLHGNPIGLTVKTIFNDHFHEPLPIGHKDSMAGRPDNDQLARYCAFACRGLSPVLVMVFKLASAAGCNIRRLSISKNALDEALVSDDPVNLDCQSKAALSSLERLELHSSELDYTKAVDKTLEAFFLQAKGLKRLEFSLGTSEYFDEDTQDIPPPSLSIDYSSQVLRMVNSDALRQVRLSDIPITDDDLLSMLLRHDRSLKELALKDIKLFGSWNTVLLSIRDKLCLDRLVMVNLNDIYEEELEEGGFGETWLSGGLEFIGNEKVMSGLTEVVSQKSRQETEPDFRPELGRVLGFGILVTMSLLRD
ncbi:hypothetical protein KCU71_g1655, partial [Aureobasidium melanogenum]